MQYLRLKEDIEWEGERRSTYGIALKEGEIVLDSIGNVCVDAEEIERIISTLNRNQVSQIHFRDILYDIVSEL